MSLYFTSQCACINSTEGIDLFLKQWRWTRHWVMCSMFLSRHTYHTWVLPAWYKFHNTECTYDKFHLNKWYAESTPHIYDINKTERSGPLVSIGLWIDHIIIRLSKKWFILFNCIIVVTIITIATNIIIIFITIIAIIIATMFFQVTFDPYFMSESCYYRPNIWISSVAVVDSPSFRSTLDITARLFGFCGGFGHLLFYFCRLLLYSPEEDLIHKTIGCGVCSHFFHFETKHLSTFHFVELRRVSASL